jgi:ribonuclease VapC
MIRSGSSPQATVLEATIVLETRIGDAGGREFDHWLLKVGAAVVLVDAEQSDAARRVRRRYGKGRHAAALNYGDCFSYALALARGEPLLFKGDDLAKTDINRRGEATLG